MTVSRAARALTESKFLTWTKVVRRDPRVGQRATLVALSIGLDRHPQTGLVRISARAMARDFEIPSSEILLLCGALESLGYLVAASQGLDQSGRKTCYLALPANATPKAES